MSSLYPHLSLQAGFTPVYMADLRDAKIPPRTEKKVLTSEARFLVLGLENVTNTVIPRINGLSHSKLLSSGIEQLQSGLRNLLSTFAANEKFRIPFNDIIQSYQQRFDHAKTEMEAVNKQLKDLLSMSPHGVQPIGTNTASASSVVVTNNPNQAVSELGQIVQACNAKYREAKEGLEKVQKETAVSQTAITTEITRLKAKIDIYDKSPIPSKEVLEGIALRSKGLISGSLSEILQRASEKHTDRNQRFDALRPAWNALSVKATEATSIARLNELLMVAAPLLALQLQKAQLLSSQLAPLTGALDSIKRGLNKVSYNATTHIPTGSKNTGSPNAAAAASAPQATNRQHSLVVEIAQSFQPLKDEAAENQKLFDSVEAFTLEIQELQKKIKSLKPTVEKTLEALTAISKQAEAKVAEESPKPATPTRSGESPSTSSPRLFFGPVTEEEFLFAEIAKAKQAEVNELIQVLNKAWNDLCFSAAKSADTIDFFTKVKESTVSLTDLTLRHQELAASCRTVRRGVDQQSFFKGFYSETVDPEFDALTAALVVGAQGSSSSPVYEEGKVTKAYTATMQNLEKLLREALAEKTNAELLEKFSFIGTKDEESKLIERLRDQQKRHAEIVSQFKAALEDAWTQGLPQISSEITKECERYINASKRTGYEHSFTKAFTFEISHNIATGLASGATKVGGALASGASAIKTAVTGVLVAANAAGTVDTAVAEASASGSDTASKRYVSPFELLQRIKPAV